MGILGIDDKYTNTGKYAIAYLDVLGTKTMLKKNKQDAFSMLWLVNHCIKKAANKYPNTIIRTFSDNFFIAHPIEEDKMAALGIITTISGIAASECLLSNETFIRGFITTGDMHIDEDTILGEPLIKAYQYEANIVKYPRIVIDKELMKANSSIIDNYQDGVFYDDDLLPCINILYCIDQNFLRWRKEYLRDWICYHLKTEKDEVLVKYLWFANYCNRYFSNNCGERLIQFN